ncbi:MAG: hypothetical protein ACQEW8_10025 [Actinomycetota bacterium]
MRIRTPDAKIGYLLVVVLGVTFTAVPLAVVSLELGFAWATVALLSAVAVAARTFRGAEESDAPRPWWKMTSTRGSGILLSVLFFVHSVTTSFGAAESANPALALIGGSLALLVAALYLNSAIRTHPAAAHHHVTDPPELGHHSLS